MTHLPLRSSPGVGAPAAGCSREPLIASCRAPIGAPCRRCIRTSAPSNASCARSAKPCRRWPPGPIATVPNWSGKSPKANWITACLARCSGSISGTSLKLFGGLDALLADFDAGFADSGHVGQRGLAPTLEAAALLARLGLSRPVCDAAELPAALDGLPLAALPLEPKIQSALKAVGLSGIGELLKLPAAPLAKRHGPAFTVYLDRLLGRRPDRRAALPAAAEVSAAFRSDERGRTHRRPAVPLQRMTRDSAIS